VVELVASAHDEADVQSESHGRRAYPGTVGG
jgi:hypothetical protein